MRSHPYPTLVRDSLEVGMLKCTCGLFECLCSVSDALGLRWPLRRKGGNILSHMISPWFWPSLSCTSQDLRARDSFADRRVLRTRSMFQVPHSRSGSKSVSTATLNQNPSLLLFIPTVDTHGPCVQITSLLVHLSTNLRIVLWRYNLLSFASQVLKLHQSKEMPTEEYREMLPSLTSQALLGYVLNSLSVVLDSVGLTSRASFRVQWILACRLHKGWSCRTHRCVVRHASWNRPMNQPR